MYLNSRQHVLSTTLTGSAVINLVTAAASAAARKLLADDTSAVPDMLNAAYWRIQLVCSAVQIVLTAILFLWAFRKVRHAMSLVSRSDDRDMAALQEEYLPGKRSHLPAQVIHQLLEVWAAILIGVDIVYNITSQLYRNFISEVMSTVNGADSHELTIFSSIYNMSHGFKYIGMLTAIALGITITGIFLHNRVLVLLTVALVAAFLACFAFAGIQTVTVGSHSYAIVWTSVLFHLLETVGLLLIAAYIHHRYVGI